MNLFKYHTTPQHLYGFDRPASLTIESHEAGGQRTITTSYVLHGQRHREDGPAVLELGYYNGDLVFGNAWWYLNGKCSATADFESETDFQGKSLVIYEVRTYDEFHGWPFTSRRPEEGDDVSLFL
jgi:hypothetical protein